MGNLTGQSLGRYHILEQLGEGGMAVVYKAYDTRLETDMAVKVIRTERLSPEILQKALKRFEREAKVLAQLTHPNIVKVLDYGEYENEPYLVMPYLSGGTLKRMLKGKPIPWQEAVRLLIPIARALDYAHKRGMIHRDVKPSNILITDSGEPMLTDFGVAKIIDEEATMDLTGTSGTVGTPEYMAPEQVTSKSIDARADIYALGVVFYEMVTGRKPYQADTPMAVLFKHTSEPLPRPKNFVLSLPDNVEQILIKVLAKKPEDRYQSAKEFAVSLENLTKTLPASMSVSHQPQDQGFSNNQRTSTQALKATVFNSKALSLLGVGLLVILSIMLLVAGSHSASPLAILAPDTPAPTPSMMSTSMPTFPSIATSTITTTPIPQLVAPILISPQNNSVIDSRVQGKITLVWEPVNGAAEYFVGVDCLDCCKVGEWCFDINGQSPRTYTTSNTYFVFEIPYANMLRWHVRAKNALEVGPQSDWWYFDCRIR